MKYDLSGDRNHPDFLNMLIEIENQVQEWHYNNIKERQQKLNKLWTNDWVAIWNGTPDTLTPGCNACLWGELRQIRHSDKCNLDCTFCYYYRQDLKTIPKDFYFLDDLLFLKDEIELLVRRRGHRIDSFAWVQKEPLIFLDKMTSLMKEIATYDKHQFLYTNGTLVTEDALKQLSDSGLNEIRFNLQATNFAADVLHHMEMAVKYIEYVCIETPMFSKTIHNFLHHKDFIKNSGIYQINVPELQLKENNIEIYKDEGPLYRNRRGLVTPLSSRHYVYDLMEIAEEENWDIVINDCSNETKFYRGTKSSVSDQFSGVAYQFNPWLEIPIENYEWALKEIIGDI